MTSLPTNRARFRSLVAVLLPLPIIPVIALGLTPGAHESISKILLSPGMVAWPLVVARILPSMALLWCAGLFWYLAAASFLNAIIAPRTGIGRCILGAFLVFAIATGLVWWSLSGWNPD